MISSCKQKFQDQKHLFLVGKHPPSTVDFCVLSGTYNLCHTTNASLWFDYIFVNLKKCWQRSRYGLALNLLCGPTTEIKNEIFYAERQKFIATASRVFGPTYARSTPHVADDVTFFIAKPQVNYGCAREKPDNPATSRSAALIRCQQCPQL